MRVLRIVAGASVLAASACSFTEGFDGFTGSSENQINTTLDDGAPGDGDANSTTGPASNAGDGSTDGAVVDPNTPPYFVDGGSFCSTQSTTSFCDDFDTVDLSKNWLREGAYAKLTSHEAKSAPNDFLLNAPATNAGGTFVSKISRDFTNNAASMIVTFDFFPEKVYVGTSFLILGAVEWSRGEQKYSVRLVYASGQIRLEESNLVAPPNNKDAYHPFFDLPGGKWSRISLDLVATGASPGVQLSVDGVPLGTREMLAPTAAMDPRPTLLLGAVFAGQPHTGWALRYDNVTVTFR